MNLRSLLSAGLGIFVLGSLIGALPAIASGPSAEFAAVRCKEWAATERTPHLYTNFGLERSGGTNHDLDCLDLFLEVVRMPRAPATGLAYELKEKDLFPTIEEVLSVAKASGAKVEIRFYLPEDDRPDPEDLTELHVLLRPRSR